MRYKKYRGRTKKEALAKARIDLPATDFYLLKEEIIKSGLFGKKKEVEVTVCIVENPYPKEEQKEPVELDTNIITDKVRKTISDNENFEIQGPNENLEIKNEQNFKVNTGNFTFKEEKVTDNKHIEKNSPFEDDLKKFLRCGDFDDNFIDVFFNNIKIKNVVNDLYKRFDIINNIDLFEKVKKELFNFIKRRVYSVDGITIEKGKNKAVVFVGPTGEGKTTTLVKVAFSLFERFGYKNSNIKIVTIDHFRIAAQQQLEMYADIVGKPFEYYKVLDDFKKDCDFRKNDIVFVDTAGRSQKDEEELSELKKFLNLIHVDKVNCLVISATKKYYDIKDIFQRFEKEIGFDYVILTKIDETNAFGQALSVLTETKKPLIYVTDGQDVAENLHPANIDGLLNINFNKMVDRFKELL